QCGQPNYFCASYLGQVTLLFSATKFLDYVSKCVEQQGMRVGGDLMTEKFSVAEVAALRNELLQGGLDSFQTAELLKMFLTGRGYGISPESALDAAGRIESNCDVEALHKELESLALVM
ncbi:MAG TPA: hypothetical protein VKE71_01265, partial [Candidatus Angelobacter sp.]|nr:hypothetical protein [Candidatus Angelobacter sp.]